VADNVNKIIIAALKPFGLPVAENIYEGTKKEYFTFNYADDAVGDMGDDVPQAYVAYMQIHYFCPLEKSYADMKRRIRKALIAAGFTPPEVVDASDLADRTRHLVFECDIENEYELEE
jgi:hypothetical protein